eukprot:157431-Hanusia_phi.AAC.1
MSRSGPPGWRNRDGGGTPGHPVPSARSLVTHPFGTGPGPTLISHHISVKAGRGGHRVRRVGGGSSDSTWHIESESQGTPAPGLKYRFEGAPEM